MRYVSAYFLMLFYLVVLFQPVLPILCDTWSHIFAEAEHIATVHAKYGSHHVGAELEKAASDENNDKSQNPTRSEESISAHIFIEEYNYDFLFGSMNIAYYVLKPGNLPDNVVPAPAPPPKYLW